MRWKRLWRGSPAFEVGLLWLPGLLCWWPFYFTRHQTNGLWNDAIHLKSTKSSVDFCIREGSTKCLGKENGGYIKDRLAEAKIS